MPVKVQEKDGEYCVTEPGGKVVKCHATKEKAGKHAAAINMSKSALALLAEAKFQDLKEARAEDPPAMPAPPIIIVSDGSPTGTRVLIHGAEVPFSDMSFYCDAHEEYASCSMNLTTQDMDLNGMKVRKSMTLRKES